MGVPDRPVLAPGVEHCDRGTYAIVTPPGEGSALHLEPDEFAVLALLDGSHTASELEAVAGRPLSDLLSDLWDEGYLVGAPERQSKRVAITLHGVEFSGFDRFVQALNSKIGNAIFSIPAELVLGLVAMSGLTFFVSQLVNGDRLTLSSASPVLAVVALRALGLAAVAPHETGHALVTARNHRHVGRVGIGFYWGALTFYVDATQALFLPKRSRMLQAASGVLTDLVTCGSAAIAASWGGNATWAVVLREFAVLGYLNIVINAVPLLELDGYWLLADTLDRPTLRRDAQRALVELVRRESTHKGLAAYGAASIIFGFGLIALGFAAWWGLFGGLFHTLWRGGPGYKVLAGYLLLPFVPIVIHLLAQPIRYFRDRTKLVELSAGA